MVRVAVGVGITTVKSALALRKVSAKQADGGNPSHVPSAGTPSYYPSQDGTVLSANQRGFVVTLASRVTTTSQRNTIQNPAPIVATTSPRNDQMPATARPSAGYMLAELNRCPSVHSLCTGLNWMEI